MRIAKENVKIMNKCTREMRDRDRECASNLVDENEMSSWKNQHKTQMNSSFSVKCDIYEQTNRIKSAKTQTR